MDYQDFKQSAAAGEEVQIAPLPRVAIQAFCETPDVAGSVHTASTDRRMSKAHVKIQMGGAQAALEAYRSAPTPNVIIIEAMSDRRGLLSALDSLSEYCDPVTKVLVIGHVNDVILYRELMRRGVSEYLIAPIGSLELLRTISEIFVAPGADPVGKVVSVVGSKGGVGASTVCHNLAWTISNQHKISTVVADLDVAFGTLGLDFNQDPVQGIADALYSPERIDSAYIDRLLSKCSETLSLLTAPAMLDRSCDFSETAIEPIVDLLRSSIPYVVLDVPHVWTAWVRKTLLTSDEVVIVATPELTSLRNSKNMYDLLKAARPNDKLPRVILNQVGVPKRPEISTQEFAKAMGIEINAVIPFDAQLFGGAANNGQMISEVQPSGKVTDVFSDIASGLLGRSDTKKQKKNILEPLLNNINQITKFSLKRA
jgi:pilus assembly protein CpaE